MTKRIPSEAAHARETFAHVVRNALRRRPNVIVVDDPRDKARIESASAKAVAP